MIKCNGFLVSEVSFKVYVTQFRPSAWLMRWDSTWLLGHLPQRSNPELRLYQVNALPTELFVGVILTEQQNHTLCEFKTCLGLKSNFIIHFR